MSRFRTLANRAAPLIAGTVAVATGVVLATVGNWEATTWAFLAAVAWFLNASHRCPAPPPLALPDRGVQLIVFTGGPLDRAEMISPVPRPDILLLNEDGFDVRGTTYRIGSVHHTAYNATAEVDR